MLELESLITKLLTHFDKAVGFTQAVSLAHHTLLLYCQRFGSKVKVTVGESRIREVDNLQSELHAKAFVDTVITDLNAITFNKHEDMQEKSVTVVAEATEKLFESAQRHLEKLTKLENDKAIASSQMASPRRNGKRDYDAYRSEPTRNPRKGGKGNPKGEKGGKGQLFKNLSLEQ